VITVGDQPSSRVGRRSPNSTGGLPLEEKDLLRTMLDAMSVIAFAFDEDGVLIYRGGGAVIHANEDVLGRRVTDIWPMLHNEVERALSGNETRFDFEYQGRTYDITYLPLIVDDGRQAGVVGLSWDVTDQRRQNSLGRRRAEVLMTLSDRENAAGMKIDVVLESIAQTAAEQLGTWAYTTLLSADNRSFEVAGGWHPDPAVRQAARGVYGRGVSADTPVFAAVVHSARALTVDPSNQNMLPELTPPELHQFQQERPAIAIAHAPLMSRGRVIGVLSVHRSTGHPDGPFTEDDIALLEDFGQRAGLHVQVLMMFRRRVQAEFRALQQARRQSALADLARTAMGPASLHDVVESAAEIISANLGNLPVTVVALDPDRGATPRADRGLPPDEPYPDGDSAAATQEHQQTPILSRPIEGADGPWGLLTVQGEEVRDPDVVAFVETACGLLGTAVLQRMTTAQLQYQALHDALTSLPNRALLQDRLQGALHRCQPGDEVVLLMMDLDRFKTVNDSAGHVVGDHLLQEVAHRLRAAFPAHTVGRLGGDEFALVAEIHGDPDGAHRLASTVADTFREPFVLPGGHELYVSAAIGMSVARHHDIDQSPEGSTDATSSESKDVTSMLREADAAMYSAKHGGGYRLFDERLRRAAHKKLDTETALRRAVAARNFLLAYQPVVRATDGLPVGVEALVRWRRDGRIVQPAEFIPAAEETGLILDIGHWVMGQAITDMASWDGGGGSPCETLAVNVSMSELQSDTYADEVLDLVSGAGLDPDRLVLEVTESMLAESLLISHRNLHRLRDAGVHVAIDDFGTGYSSLGQLTELPVDVLKIDRTFVDRMETPGSRAIVAAVVTLGHALGLTITAEGVERSDQAEQLTALECDLLQGFHFGAGVSSAQIAGMTFSTFGGRLAPG
jgi:diguanylate cyclase (GGDEF)-like protein